MASKLLAYSYCRLKTVTSLRGQEIVRQSKKFNKICVVK